MGVGFSGFDAAVAQQVLNDANIGASFQQVSSVGVAQHMHGDGPGDAGDFC